jgi:hypothetical protein
LIIILCAVVNNAIFSNDECCGPLIKPFSFTLKGGVAPSLFSNTGTIYAVVASLMPPFFQAANGQKFGQMWNNYPLDIGFDIGYALNCNVEVFGEFDYRHAKARNKSFLTPDKFTTIFPKINDFQSYGGYVGFRYFFDRIFCDKLSFFLGSKFGMVHYTKIKANPLTISNLAGTLTQNTTWYEPTNAVSGGLQVGFDLLVGKSYSFFFNAEAMVSGGQRAFVNFVKADPNIFPGFTNIVRTSPSNLISFPVNIGLRFYFG